MSVAPADINTVVSRMRNWSQRARPTDKAFVQTVPFIIGNGLSVLTTGIAAALPIFYNARLVGIQIQEIDGITGSCTFDVQTAVGGNSASFSSIIGGGAVPTITSGRFYSDMKLLGWNTTITDGQYILLNLTSNTLFTRLSVAFRIRRKDR